MPVWPFARTKGGDTGLATKRLLLRPAIPSDHAQWESVRRRNYPFLKPYEPQWPSRCLEESFFARRVERLDDDWRNDRSYCFLMVEDGNLIGGININNVTRGAAQFGSFGYWIDEARQGQGYMGEAMDAVLAHAFGTLSLERINAATLTDNTRSMKLLESRGFVREGFAKEYLQIDGARRDHILFGLTKGDYAKRVPPTPTSSPD